jgi:hypothetical protein
MAPAAAAWSRSDMLILAVLLSASLALRLALATTTSGLTMDSPLYVRMSEDLLGAHRDPAPAHHGYPMLVALAALVLPGRELPGRAVSMLASLAVVALTWLVARRRTGGALALLPASLVALHPLLAVHASAIMTESTFLALALAGVALLDAKRARAGGALLGAAWWVRPEAIVVTPLAALLAPIGWRARAIVLLVAACVALPYSVVLRLEQGHWSLTPKSVLVRAPFASPRAAEWRLADSTAFADSVGVGARLARDGASIVRAWPARAVEQGRALLDAWPWPLLAVSALALLFRAGRGPWLAFFSLPLVYPFLSAPADVRFSMLLVPALALPTMAIPLVPVPSRSWARVTAIVATLVGVALLWRGRPAERARTFDDGPMTAMRGAGAWLAAHSRPDAVVMDRKAFVPFFADRHHVQLPDEPLDRLLDYARESGATHLVVEEYVTRYLRPQLAPLLDPARMRTESRVHLVFATRPAPGEGVALFEVTR